MNKDVHNNAKWECNWTYQRCVVTNETQSDRAPIDSLPRCKSGSKTTIIHSCILLYKSAKHIMNKW